MSPMFVLVFFAAHDVLRLKNVNALELRVTAPLTPLTTTVDQI